MTVGSSSVSAIKPGRVEEALADNEKWKKLLTDAGAQNVRILLMMNSTPLRLVTAWEAEDQATLGRVGDTFMADPAALDLMRATQGADGYIEGYMTETWIEV